MSEPARLSRVCKGPVCERGVFYLLCWQRGWAPSVHYINSECHSVLEKPVILNDSLIEKDYMSGDRGAGRKSRAHLPFCVCHAPSRLSRTATCIISRQDTTYRMSWHPHRADLAISGNVQPFISPAGTKEWNDYLMWSRLFCFSAPSPPAEQILVWAAESQLWRHELFV